MARFRVRDRDRLRERVAKSERPVPHSVRSLAELAGISRSHMGHLLDGNRDTVDEEVAKRISEGVGSELADLFEPVECLDGHGHGEPEGQES